MTLKNLLYDHFGYHNFRPGQEEIIIDVLNGHDVFAMLPTGAGKSLCYQLPVYAGLNPVLVVSPLVSLMEDQVQQLKTQGEKRVVALNSFLDFEKRMSTLRNISNYSFIYVSPEILQNRSVKESLKQVSLGLMVIDEAHCISQWGHDFRTDYLKLGSIREELGNPPLLALTATASEDVREDIVKQLKMNEPAFHIHSVDRPNIAIKLEKHRSLETKVTSLLKYATDLEGPGIIYFSSRRWADKMAREMRQSGQHVASYHAGLTQEDRTLIQQQFLNDELSLVCSTNAFGMGINKKNVRFIIHFHPPLTIESYLQEIGRAGRDQKKSIAIHLFTAEDEFLPLSFIDSELPHREQMKDVMLDISMRIGERLLQKDFEIERVRFDLSETAWRYMIHKLEEHHILQNDYIVQFKLEEKLNVMMEETDMRRAEKLKKWFQFKKWLEENQCRRVGLLERFQESPIIVDPCCDYCGLDVVDYAKSTVKAGSQPGQIFDWRKELKRMFTPDKEERGEKSTG